jgi:hypothetical protein
MNKTRVWKVVGYSLIFIVMFFVMLIGVVLDTINAYPPGAIITMFGITGTRQEWFQNIFLVGIICIMIPTAILGGYVAGHYNLEVKKFIVVIIISLVIGSAIWDLFFVQLYVIPNNIDPTTFVPWFDPFGFGFLRIAEFTTELNVFKISEGVVWMDIEFLIFFSYLRLLIFGPLLIIVLWRFSKQ